MYLKKYFTIFFLLSAFLFSIEIVPLRKNPKLTEVLYVNCLQVTQIQQLLKNYILSGMKLRYKNPKKELHDSINKYEKRLYATSIFFKNALEDEHLKLEIDHMLQSWGKAKTILRNPADTSKLMILRKYLKEVADTLKKPHRILGKKSFRAIAETGGLCRRPFFIANLYFMKTWGVDIPDYMQKIDTYRKEYLKSIEVLESYKGNTEETLQLIKKAKQAFTLMNSYIDNSKKVYVPSLISKKSDNNFQYILEIKDRYSQRNTKYVHNKEGKKMLSKLKIKEKKW
jgi:hypothetical protein